VSPIVFTPQEQQDKPKDKVTTLCFTNFDEPLVRCRGMAINNNNKERWMLLTTDDKDDY